MKFLLTNVECFDNKEELYKVYPILNKYDIVENKKECERTINILNLEHLIEFVRDIEKAQEIAFEKGDICYYGGVIIDGKNKVLVIYDDYLE